MLEKRVQRYLEIEESVYDQVTKNSEHRIYSYETKGDTRWQCRELNGKIILTGKNVGAGGRQSIATTGKRMRGVASVPHL
jgi:hypothetical protein